jgi:pimeloyl-ACP methyl ester carboxylesterase
MRPGQRRRVASAAVPHADVNGIRLYYEEHGAGEPLLCVMGLGADHLGWAFQVGDFAQRFRTFVFDNRDIGQSTIVDADYELADMAADTLALADHLGLDDFHLLGISMGAAIAQHAALAAPERIRTLTLAAAWGGASALYGELRTKAWERDIRTASREDFLETMMLLTLGEDLFADPAIFEQAKRLALAVPHPQPPEAFIRQARAAGRHDVRDRLHELAMPVHVISGSHDVLIPPFKQRELADLIPGAELTTIEGAAHSMNMVSAQEFTRTVLDFLVSNVRSSG